eukprot:jgi/Bigna1/144855/aug1.92_g19563
MDIKNADKIKVTNISSLVNAEHLKDLFNSFGTIVTMSAMTKDGEAKNGDSQMLTIEFKTADEADAAVSLSGTELGDRPFVVERMKEGGEAAAAPSADANGEAAKGGGGGEKGGEKGDKDDGEKDRKKNDDDDDDASDSDRRSKRRKKKRSPVTAAAEGVRGNGGGAGETIPLTTVKKSGDE